jgi:MFS transporter, CP family, cyanate transporter
VAQSRSFVISLVLLWLIGNALRLTILAVPPVIPALRAELHLSGTDIGILTGLPVVLYAAAALAGSRLIARVGVVTAVVVGLMLTAIGSALRGMAPDVLTLLAATAVMGVGVAVTQPALPALVGQWLPRHIALGTGTFTNGLLVGEILPVALFPVLFPLLGGSWRATFVLWAIPIAAIALLFIAIAPRTTKPAVATSRWWPDGSTPEILRISVIFGAASALYYGSNAFLPGYFTGAGRPDLINPALTALNTGQLPASLLLIAFARRLERRVWPFVATGIVSIGCLVIMMTTANAFTVAAIAVFGFAIGAGFALGLTLPPLLSAPGEVARVSAAMFTISYASAMAVAVIGGLAWDLTGVERAAFLPIVLSALPLILLAPTLTFDRKGVTLGEA